MNNNSTTLTPKTKGSGWIIIVVIVGFLQVVFALAHQRYFVQLNQERASIHADVVANSLWQYDSSTVEPYLRLALESGQYRTAQVLDATGEPFITLSRFQNGNHISWLTSALSQLESSYQAEIIYGERNIGTLSIVVTAIPTLVTNTLFFICAIVTALIIRAFFSDRWYRMTLENFSDQLRSANTSLANAAQAADKANESKTEFLANMSHEIRTPMNGVLGLAELLEQTTLNTEQEKYVLTIKQSGNILLSIINDILDLSKIESGKLNILLDTVDIHELINNITLPFKYNCHENLALETEIAPDVPQYIETDAVRLQQIVTNLLNNAFKFTASGKISISITHIEYKEKPALSIKVSDTGIGIDKVAQESLFNPFVQANINTNREYGGTGLGLSICNQLVNLLGGTIQLDSKPDHGSTFTVLLPINSPSENHKKPQKATALNDSQQTICNSLQGKRVLIVDDNPINVMVTAGFLDKIGIPATTAEDGQAALDLIYNGKRFDLIFMDCEMPVMDGFKATEAIRAWESAEKHQPARICALTSHALPEYDRKCIDAGMDDYLTKPITFSMLTQYLEKITAS